MLENLNRRGIFLPGLSACETREKQQQRYMGRGLTLRIQLSGKVRSEE